MYQFFDASGKILYVGKAKNLRNRVSSYFQKSAVVFGKTALLVAQVKKIKVIPVESEIEALLLEANLIKTFSPKYNISLKDGKRYPLIRISVKDTYPAVLTARRMDDAASIYFGPFPSSSAMRSVLRLLRKIFPYHSVLRHPPKICLYYHIGLCPCIPARIGLNPIAHDEGSTLIKEYKKTIRHIIDFLNGKTKKILQELEKERDALAKNEAFEQAALVQKQIDQIRYVTTSTHKPFEYESNPNLKSDLRRQEMESLQQILHAHAMKIKLPRRIECYDNSNFQGTNPTSSMVVLTDGEIDKSQYRKFKIRTVTGPNDFASMEEVLTRRLRHKEWPLPDLLIVDGGKGQVSSAKKALEMSNLKYQIPNIPIIGLAKREETIITSDLQEILLPKSSPALLLVMRIRDEAHRFAITFHKKLRSKNNFL